MVATQLLLSAILLLAGYANAALWTVTSYMVAQPTTAVITNTYYSQTQIYASTTTEYLGLKENVTPTVTTPISTTTYEMDDSVEYVLIYLDPSQVDPRDIMTTTPLYFYPSEQTTYVQEVFLAAPASCPTPFVASYYSEVYIPDMVTDQVTVLSVATGTQTDYYDGEIYTFITAYLPNDTIPFTATEDFYYNFYVLDCSYPQFPSATATSTSSSSGYDSGIEEGSDSDGFSDSDGYRSRYDSDGCSSMYGCGFLMTYIIILVALTLWFFLVGFIESYFWFRRLMIGKNALRFGTISWIFLLLPVLCLTRNVPARDAETQKRLREEWKKVPIGKAIGMWLRIGFRHRYPVELLGIHPQYQNPGPVVVQPPIGQKAPGPPPPSGYFYFAPGPAPDGQQPGQYPVTPAQTGMPPPGTIMYYPQYPQPTYASPQVPFQPPATELPPVSRQFQAPQISPIAVSPQPSTPAHETVSPASQTSEPSHKETQAGPSGTQPHAK